MPRQNAPAGQDASLSDDALRRAASSARPRHFPVPYAFSKSMEFRVKRAPRIDAEISVPGDKSISHRGVIIGGLSNGVCVLRGFLPSEDCLRTVAAMRALGIKVEQPEPDMLDRKSVV